MSGIPDSILPRIGIVANRDHAGHDRGARVRKAARL